MSLNCFNVILADTAPATTAPAGGAPAMLQFVPFILMFVVLYMLLIRPQSKKAKEHAKLLGTLKPGDKIVTGGGVVGTVVSVKDRTVAIRSVETKLEVLKSSVTEITERAGESNVGES